VRVPGTTWTLLCNEMATGPPPDEPPPKGSRGGRADQLIGDQRQFGHLGWDAIPESD